MNTNLKNQNSIRFQSFKRSVRTGFSLLELIVSVAIFSIIVLLAAGGLIRAFDANSKTRAVQSIIDNLNASLEDVARNLRTGHTFNCGEYFGGTREEPKDCPNGDSTISFYLSGIDPEPLLIYTLNSATNAIEKSTNGGISFVSQTSPNIVVEHFKFYVTGSCPPAGVGSCEGGGNDGSQPKVLIVVRGYIKEKNLTTEFNLQTTVSGRFE